MKVFFEIFLRGLPAPCLINWEEVCTYFPTGDNGQGGRVGTGPLELTLKEGSEVS